MERREEEGEATRVDVGTNEMKDGKVLKLWENGEEENLARGSGGEMTLCWIDTAATFVKTGTNARRNLYLL